MRLSNSILSPKLSALFLVSEPVLLLKDSLVGLSKDDALMGFQSVLRALDFLHSRV